MCEECHTPSKIFEAMCKTGQKSMNVLMITQATARGVPIRHFLAAPLAPRYDDWPTLQLMSRYAAHLTPA